MKEKFAALLAWAGALAVSCLARLDALVAPVKSRGAPAWAKLDPLRAAVARVLGPVWAWTAGPVWTRFVWPVLAWLWSGVTGLARNPASLAVALIALVVSDWHMLRATDRLVATYRGELVTRQGALNQCNATAAACVTSYRAGQTRIKALEEELGKRAEKPADKAAAAPAPAPKGKKKGRG